MKLLRHVFVALLLLTAPVISSQAFAQTILAETPTGWTTPANYGGTDAPVYNSTTITATSAGTAVNIRAYLPADAWSLSGTTFKICIYRQSTGNLTSCATFVVADGTGTVTKALASTFAVSNTEQFYPLYVGDGNARLDGDGGSFNTQNGTGTFASPPSSIAPGSDGGNARGRFRISIDGTTSGASTLLIKHRRH